MARFIEDMNKNQKPGRVSTRGSVWRVGSQYVQKCNTVVEQGGDGTVAEDTLTRCEQGVTLARDSETDTHTHSEVTGGHGALVKHPVVSLW